MASAATAVPPLPPDVTQQQGPPLSRFAEGAMKKGVMAGPDAHKQSIEFAKKLMKEIGDKLTQVAQVVDVEKPAMMPLIVRMAGVGAAIEKQFATEAQGQGPKQPSAEDSGPEPTQGQSPAPESQEALGL